MIATQAKLKNKSLDLTEGSLDRIAYETAFKRMIWVMLAYPLNCLMGAGSGVAKGLGRSAASMLISLIGACAFRVIWIVTVFNAFPSLESIYVSYPISWALTSAAQLVLVTFGLRRLIKTSLGSKV